MTKLHTFTAAKVTPRRLEVLRSIKRFGVVIAVERYGYNVYDKLYVVRSLTELVESTTVIKDCRTIGWLARRTLVPSLWNQRLDGMQPYDIVLTAAGEDLLRRYE